MSTPFHLEKKSLVFKGYPPNHCCCDSTWRRLPNGEQAVFFLTGNDYEPGVGNYVAMSRSADEGESWSKIEEVLTNPGKAATLSEVVIHEGVITIYVQIHHGRFDHMEAATVSSNDNGKTWGKPEIFAPVPRRSMIRNLYKTSWGEWCLPYQYYEEKNGEWEKSILDDGSRNNPWNGVLIAKNPNGPWEKTQAIQGANCWAEVNIVELSNGSLVMLARSDKTGLLLKSTSIDRGRTWSPYERTDIPNPGTKFRLYRLRDGRIVLLHNPNPLVEHPNNNKPCCHVIRNPLSLWISGDDMKTWGYKRDITDFPGQLAYPDGELDEDEKFLHFAFDYNRHDVIYWKVAIPNS